MPDNSLPDNRGCQLVREDRFDSSQIGLSLLYAEPRLSRDKLRCARSARSSYEVGSLVPPCMDRAHGGRVFGDMVDTFEYVRHRA